VPIAEDSGVFVPGWEDKILTTDLRQIWRDHLLVLSMRNHPEQWTDQTRDVLLCPSRNVSFSQADRAYADVLVDGTPRSAATPSRRYSTQPSPTAKRRRTSSDAVTSGEACPRSCARL
jgi:hypothetical protein